MIYSKKPIYSNFRSQKWFIHQPCHGRSFSVRSPPGVQEACWHTQGKEACWGSPQVSSVSSWKHSGPPGPRCQALRGTARDGEEVCPGVRRQRNLRDVPGKRPAIHKRFVRKQHHQALHVVGGRGFQWVSLWFGGSGTEAGCMRSNHGCFGKTV